MIACLIEQFLWEAVFFQKGFGFVCLFHKVRIIAAIAYMTGFIVLIFNTFHTRFLYQYRGNTYLSATNTALEYITFIYLCPQPIPSIMDNPKYIDLRSDFSFKRVFGTDANKDLLIAFLNELFQGRKVIE